jgi:hypothetical protein
MARQTFSWGMADIEEPQVGHNKVAPDGSSPKLAGPEGYKESDLTFLGAFPNAQGTPWECWYVKSIRRFDFHSTAKKFNVLEGTARDKVTKKEWAQVTQPEWRADRREAPPRRPDGARTGAGSAVSLYEMLFRRHPAGPEILAYGLGLDFSKIGRLRDCYPVQPPLGEVGVVHVLTRTGGGNRSQYVEEDNYLRSSPHYIKDYDDEYDSTYAIFEFSTPESLKQLKELYESMTATDPAKRDAMFYKHTLKERFEQATKELQDPNSKEGKRILEASRPIMDQLKSAMSGEPGAPKIITIDGGDLNEKLEERRKKN